MYTDGILMANTRIYGQDLWKRTLIMHLLFINTKLGLFGHVGKSVLYTNT